MASSSNLDLAINALRQRQKRNMLTTLFLSQGVPMHCMGDEVGRTQQGNNNGYCQDNEISWFNWNWTKLDQELLDFTRFLIELRQKHPVFHRRQFFQGRRIHGAEVKDLSWFRPDGKEMTEDDWNQGYARCLGVRLAGDAIAEIDTYGNQIKDDTFLILVNAHHEPRTFVLPAHKRGVRWELGFDTREGLPSRTRKQYLKGGESYDLEHRSMAVLKLKSK